MAIRLTEPILREIFPRAHPVALQSFITDQALLDKHGVSHTRMRLAHMLTHLYVESLGLSVFRENLNYRADQLLRTFPRYFRDLDHASQYAMQPQKIANYVYGNRMGNGPASSGDGWRYAGKSGTQITGKDGYAAITRFSGHDFVGNPEDAADPKYACMIAVAFWSWKNVAPAADTGDIDRTSLLWNGGYNGISERRHHYPRILKILERAEGSPPTAVPPPAAVSAATKNEKVSIGVGVATGASGAAAKVMPASDTTPADKKSKTQTVQPDKPAEVSTAWSVGTWVFIGLGIAIVAVAAVMLVKKVSAINANWK